MFYYFDVIIVMYHQFLSSVTIRFSEIICGTSCLMRSDYNNPSSWGRIDPLTTPWMENDVDIREPKNITIVRLLKVGSDTPLLRLTHVRLCVLHYLRAKTQSICVPLEGYTLPVALSNLRYVSRFRLILIRCISSENYKNLLCQRIAWKGVRQ